jgi:ferrous iron transport protein A
VSEVVGNDEVAIRLMEMGIVPGASISMIGVAPLGDPLEFSLRGYRLSLRRNEAQRVFVTGS